jgi:hypothetical protein
MKNDGEKNKPVGREEHQNKVRNEKEEKNDLVQECEYSSLTSDTH